MEMLQNKKGRSMNGVDGLIILVAVLFAVLCFLIVEKRNETRGARALEISSDTKDLVGTLETNQNQMREELKRTALAQEAIMTDLKNRVDNLEKRPQSLKVEPIQVSVVERQVLPAPPPQITGGKGKKPKSLLERARENN